MKNEGWSYGDLAGELWVRGIDPEEAYLDDHILSQRTPSDAARIIEREYYPRSCRIPNAAGEEFRGRTDVIHRPGRVHRQGGRD